MLDFRGVFWLFVQSSFGKCSSVVPFTWEHKICETWKEIPTWHEVFMTDKMWGISQFPAANFQEDHWVSRFRVAVDFLGTKERNIQHSLPFPNPGVVGIKTFKKTLVLLNDFDDVGK